MLSGKAKGARRDSDRSSDEDLVGTAGAHLGQNCILLITEALYLILDYLLIL